VRRGELEGTAGQDFVLEATTEIGSGVWAPVVTVLPPNSAYTYAVELSADEAVVKIGGKDVLFSL